MKVKRKIIFLNFPSSLSNGDSKENLTNQDENSDQSQILTQEEKDKIKEEFISFFKEALLDVGITAKYQYNKFIFNPKNFLHKDIQELIKYHGFYYCDFADSWPTTAYSENGSDKEYYIEKNFDDFKFVVRFNISKGIIQIDSMTYQKLPEKKPFYDADKVEAEQEKQKQREEKISIKKAAKEKYVPIMNDDGELKEEKKAAKLKKPKLTKEEKEDEERKRFSVF